MFGSHRMLLAGRRALALLAVAASLAAQDQVLSFGVYSFSKPTEVYKKFRPAIAALQRDLDAEKVPLKIDVQVFKTYEGCLDAFVAGKVDFVRFGPASYVLAKKLNPDIQLLAVEIEGGKKACQGVIAVRADSPIRTLADLRGKRFAFGDRQSTIGRFLSQAELVKAGMTARDLAGGRPEYLDRHDIVFKSVQIGDHDAGAMHIETFNRLNATGRPLRILHSFDNVGKPWIARAGLEDDTVNALRRALLRLEDVGALKALAVDGLAEGKDKDFDPVREGMRLAERFDPKEPTPAPPAAPGKRP